METWKERAQVGALLGCMLWGCFAGAQTPPTTRISGSYKQNAGGLRKEFGAFLKANANGDQAAANQAFSIFNIPDGQTWFGKYFQKSEAQQLAWDQGGEVEAYEKSLISMMALLGPIGTPLQVQCRRYSKPAPFPPRTDAVVPSVTVPVEQYTVELESESHRASALINVVYVDGAYRYVGKGAYPFWAMPDATRGKAP